MTIEIKNNDISSCTITGLKSLEEVYVIEENTQKIVAEGIVQVGETSICLNIPIKYPGEIRIITRATGNPYQGFIK